MSIGQEVSGVALKYVARKVEGEIPQETAKFNQKLGETEKKQSMVKDPMIVFFPNKTVQVMSQKSAEKYGFLELPDIMNFASVSDNKTAAGRYKFGVRNAQKEEAWLDLEQATIIGCTQQTGHPLPEGVTFSQNSIYLDAPKEREI